MYPSKITDKEGNQLLVECEYGIMGTEDPSCIYMTLTYPNGLQTVLDKTAAYTTDIRNYDGQTALSRFEYIVDAHGLKVSQARYYPDPNGSTYNNWSYTYSFFNLTDISKLSVSYSYNSYGRVTVAQSGGVYFRYEYPSGGGLYPIRAYGPGTASENGPMTEFVYDTNDRIIQVKPPNMGADGISFEYDTRGRLITQTAADGTEQSYTYDDRGNRITYTDAENHTWTYTYDDLGRVATQTDPENQVTSYTYTGSCTSCSARRDKSRPSQCRGIARYSLSMITTAISSCRRIPWAMRRLMNMTIWAASSVSSPRRDVNRRLRMINSGI